MQNPHAEHTVDHLERWGLELVQQRHGFRFGVDAVVLASAVTLAPGARALELGAGCGVVSLILARRFPAAAQLVALELDPGAAALAARNARANGEARVVVVRADYTRLPLRGRFDVVLGNPPWRPAGSGRDARGTWRRSATVESRATLEGTVAAAAGAVAPGGVVVLMYPAVREDDLRQRLAAHGLGVARVLRVAGVVGRAPDRIVVQATPGAAGEVVEEALAILDEDGCYTEAAARAYGYESVASMTRGGRQARGGLPRVVGC